MQNLMPTSIRGLFWPIKLRFQVNRPGKSPTAPTEISELASVVDRDKSGLIHGRWPALIEILLILFCFAVYSGQVAPDVNESHYLTKAKHFWNPAWCPSDIFLGSAFAHWWFYFSTGWLTLFVSLSTFAWIGRIVTWLMLATAWRRLSFALIPHYGIAFVSAALFLLLNDRFHMAGEWVVGGFEAKGLAYAFVLFALERMVKADWRTCWLLLGIASSFHVLVGGWATLSALLSWAIVEFRGRSLPARMLLVRKSLPGLVGGFVIALIGILPPLVADWNTATEFKTAASQIYVESRISHHLMFGSFPIAFVARFVGMTLAWILFCQLLKRNRQLKPLHWFCAGSLLISFGGLLLCGLEEQASTASISRSLLRFYWFRLSDFAVPLTLSMCCLTFVRNWIVGSEGSLHQTLAWLFTVLILAATSIAIYERHQDQRPIADQRSLPTYEESSQRTVETFRNWKKVCEWIRANTPADAAFITPLEQQTFKWYAHRAEIACWKDVPQDAEAMVEWYRRIGEVIQPQKQFEAGLFAYNDEQLISLAKKYEADYLVIPQRQADLARPQTRLKQVYPATKSQRSTYVVFQF